MMTKEEAILELEALEKSGWTDRGMVHGCADNVLLKYLEENDAVELAYAWRQTCREV